MTWSPAQLDRATGTASARCLFPTVGLAGLFRSLRPQRNTGTQGRCLFLDSRHFIQQNDPYFKTHGFFERSVAYRVEEFGNLVEVWSTNESRDAKDDAQHPSRGIDAFQIVHAQGHLLIVKPAS